MTRSEHIKVLNARSALAVAIAAVVVVTTLGLLWFAVRFQIGDLVSDVTSPADISAPAYAETSIKFSPLNPRSYWLKGAVLRTSFDTSTSDAAVTAFSSAARLGPSHYLWWTELGRAKEQSGDAAGAEAAYNRAVELAPHYTTPRWQLGNFYLRQGNSERAIAELRVAAQRSKLYRGQVFAIAWNVFGQDPASVEQFATDTDDSKASLALFYASQNRPEFALKHWNSIPDAGKSNYSEDAEVAARILLNHKSYSGALEFARQAGVDPNARAEAVTNGDFESAIKDRDQLWFDWWVGKRDPKVDILLDGRVMRSGSRSFRMLFKTFTTHWMENLVQTVVLVPGKSYRLSYSVRTEGLTGGSLPRLEILSAIDSSYVAVSPAFPSGTGEWRQDSVEFTAPSTTDGYILKIGREPCPDECPLSGTVWLDSVEITRN